MTVHDEGYAGFRRLALQDKSTAEVVGQRVARIVQR